MNASDQSDELQLDGSVIDQVAQRYRSRSGCRLVDYDQIALPVYKLTLNTLLHVKNRISPIDEFILKSLDTGLESEATVAAFLGLELPVIKEALLRLVGSDDVYLAARPGERQQRLILTEKGRSSLSNLQTVAPEERMIPIYFDGITRRPIRSTWFLKSRDLQEDGIREIPTYQPRPEIDELRIKDVQAAIRETMQARDSNYEVLAIRSIERRELLFQKAVILVYRGELGFEDKFQVGFAIDGRISPEHEQAFAALDGVRRLGIPNQIWSNDEKLEKIDYEIPQVVGVDQQHIDHLQNDTANTEAALHDAEQKARDAESVVEKESANTEIQRLRDRIAVLENELENIDIRPVEVFEHPKLLRKALWDCKKRLMIIAPWIRASVVRLEFLGPLERALKRNVEIYIGYGLGEDDEGGPADQRAEKDLQQLAAKYTNFKLQRLGDTHAKVLICDDRFAVVTSFNWLSFRGDAKRTFRDERGTYIGIPAKVEDQWQSVIKRF